MNEISNMIFLCHWCGKVLIQEEIDCHKTCSKCGKLAFIMAAELDIEKTEQKFLNNKDKKK